MAATLTEKRFNDPDWLFERKYDGIRLLAFKEGGAVRLITRYRTLQDIPALAASIAGTGIQWPLPDYRDVERGRGGEALRPAGTLRRRTRLATTG
jgi:hypothetical protein